MTPCLQGLLRRLGARAPQAQRSSLAACLVTALGLAGLAAAARAQPTQVPCIPGGGTIPAPVAAVQPNAYTSIVWDPDLDGPLRPRPVIGGTNNTANVPPLATLAAWDPDLAEFVPVGVTAAAPLGGVSNGTSASWVFSMAVAPNNDLVVAGRFTSAGGVPALNIARWNGQSWSAFGQGLVGDVYALAFLPDGSLIAGGQSGIGGSTDTVRVARWDGTAWAALPGVQSFAPATTNSLVVTPGSGAFGVDRIFMGTGTAGLWSWSGQAETWTQLTPGTPGAIGTRFVSRSLTGAPLTMVGFGRNGFPTDLIGVATPGLVEWNGSVWTEIGPRTFGFIPDNFHRVTQLAPGSYVITGTFNNADGLGADSRGASILHNGSYRPAVDSFSGTTFSTVIRLADGRALLNSSLLMHIAPGATPTTPVAVTDTLIRGPGGRINVLRRMANGDVLAGGSFSAVNGEPASGLAIWNGSSWRRPPGMGGPLAFSAVTDAIELPNGNLVISGSFGPIGSFAARGVAMWDGTAWSNMGGGMVLNDPNLFLNVASLSLLPDGRLLAGGTFTTAGGLFSPNVAVWNGTAWSRLGTANFFTAVNATAVSSDGRALVGGAFPTNSSGRNVSQLIGSTWSPMGPGLETTVRRLLELPGGGLLAARDTSPTFSSTRVSRWNGATWTELGGVEDSRGEFFNEVPPRLRLAPDGSPILAGQFTTVDSQSITGLARFNGVAWERFPLASPFARKVRDIAFDINGDAIVAEQSLPSLPSPAFFARFTTRNGRPAFSQQPLSATACTGQAAIFSVTATSGNPMTYQWRRNFVPIDPALNPTAATATLVIDRVRVADAGSYDCVVSTACASTTSLPGVLDARFCPGTPCTAADIAGFGQSVGADGRLSADDIVLHLTWFFSGDARADISGPNQSPEPDQDFSADDIIVFLNRYFVGC